MFPISGNVSQPPPVTPPPPVSSGSLVQPVSRRAFASNLLGEDSVGALIRTAADLNTLHLVHGTSASFATQPDNSVVWFTQVLLGLSNLTGSLSGSFQFFVNGSAQWPVELRAPINDVIQHNDNTFTEDWKDTERWGPGSLVQVTRFPAGTVPGAPPGAAVWKTKYITYEYAPVAALDRLALATIS
jgi:hypothetical protein